MKLEGERATGLGVVAAVGVLYAIPLLLAGRPYIDDLKRVMTGETAWIINGRPFSDVLMVILNTGYPLADLAPLTQIGAIALYCVACLLLFKWTAGLTMPAFWRALLCTAPLLSPFLLQNNAYRFDSLPMAAAFLACVWAARPNPAHWILALLRTAGFVFLGLCIYQAAANVTVAVAILLLVVEVRRADPEREIWRRLGTRIGGFAVGSIVYATTVGAVLIGGSYTLAHSSRVPLSFEGLQRVLSNFEGATALILSGFDFYQLWLLAGAGVIALATIAYLLVARARAGKVSWGLALVCVVAIAVLGFTPLGLSGALQRPVMESRVLMAFGVVLAFVLLFAAEGLFALRRPGVVRPVRALAAAGVFFVVLMPMVACLTIAYAFGSAQARQDEADTALAQEIRTGLNVLAVHKPFYLAVDGRQPFAGAAQTTVNRAPILAKIVPRYMRRDWFWSVGLLRYKGIPARFDIDKSDKAIAETKGQAPGYRGTGFNLTLAGDTVVLRFD